MGLLVDRLTLSLLCPCLCIDFGMLKTEFVLPRSPTFGRAPSEKLPWAIDGGVCDVLPYRWYCYETDTTWHQIPPCSAHVW